MLVLKARAHTVGPRFDLKFTRYLVHRWRASTPQHLQACLSPLHLGAASKALTLSTGKRLCSAETAPSAIQQGAE